jgi:triacylglycerol lipase
LGFVRYPIMVFFKSLILLVLVSACGPSGPASRNTINKQKINDGAANQIPAPKDDLPITTGACPKQPVMFLHGLMGGSKTSFAGVIKHFQGLGCKVTLPDVSAVNSTELRTTQVADKIKLFLSSSLSAKVNIVAHSQGGLDARYALSKLGMAVSVASLSMLSTPNYGSPLADLVLKDLGNPLSKIFLSFAFNSLSGVSNTDSGQNNDSTSAMRALSTAYMSGTFNPNTPDASGVLYQSWAGRTGPGTKDRNKDTLWATQAYLAKQAGDNDGIVSVASARWGEFKGVLDADHLDLGGTKMGDGGADQFEQIKFLEQLLQDLRAKGL